MEQTPLQGEKQTTPLFLQAVKILNKRRTELGKKMRNAYENGKRTDGCIRSNLFTPQIRPDNKSGTLTTFDIDNLVLKIYGMDTQGIYAKAEQQQLEQFQKRMGGLIHGAEFEVNGTKYIAAIRRLTPLECRRLQGVPDWYDFDGISEQQQYKMLGNGWQCDVIKHCFQYIPKFDRPIRVWSLFDGMGCAYIALKELSIPIEHYVSSEINKQAIKAEKKNIPNIIQVGSVTDIDVAELVRQHGIPDFLCGGSPCQSFSFSGKRKGMSAKTNEEIYTLERYLQLKREGMEFEGESFLYWEFVRVLTELRKFNPNIFFSWKT